MAEKSSLPGPVIVALGYDASGGGLVRAGYALARESGAALECVTIDTGVAASAEEGERLAEAQRLARGLGAAIASAPDIDAAAGLLKYAGGHDASAIVAGMGRKRIFGKGVVERLRLNSRDFSVVAVASPRSDGRAKGSRRLAGYFEESAGQFAAAIVVIAAVTGLNLALAAYAGYWAAAITYLAAISISALFLDRWPVFLAALLSAVAWDFLFIPPRYTMFISRTEDVLMLVLYFLVALCSGWMTGRLRASERLLAARENRLSRLSALASALAGAKTMGIILDKSIEAIKDAFSVEAIAILRDDQGSLRHQAESGWEPLDSNARDAARASFEGLKGAGRFTELYPESEWHFVPMEGPRGCLGVIGLRAAHNASWSEELESFLRTITLTVSSAVARELPEA
jgi:two-component system sensor histidine kinase KdpD